MRPDQETRFWNAFVVTWIIFVVICLLTLLTGCGPQPAFKTNCGMVVDNAPELENVGEFGWTQENVQRLEDEFREVFATVNDDRVQNYCTRIRGSHVYVRDETMWKNWQDINVAGETMCFAGTFMYINHHPPGRSSLPHEIVHTLQSCDTRIESADYHAGWVENGIYDAIGEIYGREYDRMVDAGVNP